MKTSILSWRKSDNDLFSASGAAAAQTAAYGGVPFAVLRVISDQADGRAAESFEAFEEQTAALSAAVIVRLLDLI